MLGLLGPDVDQRVLLEDEGLARPLPVLREHEHLDVAVGVEPRDLKVRLLVRHLRLELVHLVDLEEEGLRQPAVEALAAADPDVQPGLGPGLGVVVAAASGLAAVVAGGEDPAVGQGGRATLKTKAIVVKTPENG